MLTSIICCFFFILLRLRSQALCSTSIVSYGSDSDEYLYVALWKCICLQVVEENVWWCGIREISFNVRYIYNRIRTNRLDKVEDKIQFWLNKILSRTLMAARQILLVLEWIVSTI